MGMRPEEDRLAGPDATVGAVPVDPTRCASRPPRGFAAFGARSPELGATSPQFITPTLVAAGRVEGGRGGLGHAASPRFPSPLVKPDVRISRIRLSDWLHPKAHGGGPRCTRRRRSTPSAPKT